MVCYNCIIVSLKRNFKIFQLKKGKEKKGISRNGIYSLFREFPRESRVRAGEEEKRKAEERGELMKRVST